MQHGSEDAQSRNRKIIKSKDQERTAVNVRRFHAPPQRDSAELTSVLALYCRQHISCAYLSGVYNSLITRAWEVGDFQGIESRSSAVIELLKALDFLHTHGEVVHTDVHPGNLLLGVDDNDLLRSFEERELSSPVPRKLVSPTRLIYLSRLMRPNEGPMLLSDFGEARIGPGPHSGDIMPLEYRAPETLHYVGWSYPVDIWSVGLTAWDLLESKKLFTARDEDGDLYDAAHLAQLIAALGPPPPEFLARNLERKADFWDEQGTWLGLAPIPSNRTMEALETRLDDKTGFLRFIRRTLTWIPEERATAKELLQDPWLTGEATWS